jgi:DNA polymerase-3 subunit alpha
MRRPSKLFARGDTFGVFQFDVGGMQRMLRRSARPFDDLVALNALYRPGPMDYIPRSRGASTTPRAWTTATSD